MIKYNKDNPLRVFEAFAGYGSQALALKRLKEDFPEFDYKIVGWSEFDPQQNKPIDKQAAVVAHKALHEDAKDCNFGDVSKIDWSKVPDFDLFTYSFPCTDLSQAGLQKGLEEGSNTRSSLLWECRKTIVAKRPKYLLMENVSAFVSQKFLTYFLKWQRELEEYGYTNFAKVLNAKNYGVPQNRERIFLFSIYDPEGKEKYHFPKQMPLHHTLQEELDDIVDTKYYLNPIKVNEFIQNNLLMITKYMDESKESIEPLPAHLREFIDKAAEESYNNEEGD